jgi:predicted transcriptional regulator
MKELTEAELELMKYMWDLKKAYMKDIVNAYEDPKPAYTTISTLLKRLCDKEALAFDKVGRDKHYYPLLSKRKYFGKHLKKISQTFFNNSTAQFASFFAEETDLSQEELKELKRIIDQKIDKDD